MAIDWICKPFEALSAAELYQIMRLRSEVFVVEQNCVYLDADNKDQSSFHLAGWQDGELMAYCRLLPPALSFQEASIGRVISNPKFRRTGAGREMMPLAIQHTRSLFQTIPIRIGAQRYLEKFYQSFGFQIDGDEYLEDGIPHIEMILKG